MDQFDKLIKDKINSKSYDYSPQAWKSFKKRSGMPMIGTAAKTALVIGAAAVFTSTVLFFTLPSDDQPATGSTILSQEQIPENKNMDQSTDTVVYTEIIESKNSTCSHLGKPNTTITTTASAKSQADSSSQVPSPKQTQAQSKPQSTYYGRPLEILVDTISSIDFPDYEVKPADMLP